MDLITGQITEMVSPEDSYEHLRETGIFFQKKTVESLIAFSVVVNTLKVKCEGDEEQDFNGLCLEYWGLSQSGASQTAKIGARASDLLPFMEKLPPSSRALYELTALKPKELKNSIEQGLVTPNLTVTEAKALKLALKDDKENKKTAPNEAENPFAVQAHNEAGEAVTGELLPAADITVEDEKPKRQKMKPDEATDILNINVKQYYDNACRANLVARELLDEAYKILGGKVEKK